MYYISAVQIYGLTVVEGLPDQTNMLEVRVSKNTFVFSNLLKKSI
jgi:hypothetical protein